MRAFPRLTHWTRKTNRALPRGVLCLAVTSALCGMAAGAQAQGFPLASNLGELDGSNGFKLDGEAPSDRSGLTVGAAGDINGDGLGDLIVGAYGAGPNGAVSGRSYVVFGKTAGFASPLQLSALDGSSGFKIDGEVSGDRSGRSVSAAGDINGDGVDDLVIGAYLADPNGAFSGRSYVVFGRTSGFASPLQLSALNGGNGFKLDGEATFDRSGISVGAAGDINGDGLDDLIVGATGAGPGGGRSYLVFGRTSGFASPLQLSDLNGSNGSQLDGELFGDSGYSAGAAGDVNGDGVDDLIVGALNAGPNGTSSGRSYVVFGNNSGIPSPLSLAALNGNDGFKLDGQSSYDFSGISVGAAGDVNGDGVDDLLIGADGAGPSGFATGSAYVVFGKTSGFAAQLQLSSLNGSNGFRLDGEAVNDRFGRSVNRAGDVNGDGLDDLLIGAYLADPNGSSSGRGYVVFGRTSGFSSPLNLSDLQSGDGFKLNGEAAGDDAGRSIGAAGDVNGDGVDDLIIGASGADPNGSNSGRSYVVFGQATGTPALDFGGMKLVDFGAVQVGAAGATRTMVLNNPGDAMVTIFSIDIADPAFTAQGGSCGPLPIRIQVDAFCTLDVRFAPQVEGFVLTQARFESNSVSSPDSVFLQGIAESGQLLVDGFEGP